jgi:hypothetical protein
MGKMNIKKLMESTKGVKPTKSGKEVIDLKALRSRLEELGFEFEIAQDGKKIFFRIGKDNWNYINEYNLEKHNGQNYYFVNGQLEIKTLGFKNIVEKYNLGVGEDLIKEIYMIRKSEVDGFEIKE